MPSLSKFLIPNKPNPKHRLLPSTSLPDTPSIRYENQPSNRASTSQREPAHSSHGVLFRHLRSTPRITEARKLHGLVVVNGFLHKNFSLHLGAQLVDSYVVLHRLEDALLVFDHMPDRNVYSWNSILKGLVDAGHFEETVERYHRMIGEGLRPDNFTYPAVLRACSGLGTIEQGREIQKTIEYYQVQCNLKPNIHVQCATIDMLAKCGDLEEARRVFDRMAVRDLVSWTALICGTVQAEDWEEALLLFRRMRSEGYELDSVIVATVLPACGRLGLVELGMELQCCVVKYGFENDLCVQNALIDMYCKGGYTNLARNLFHEMKDKDVVSWNSLIGGYSQNCQYIESLDLYAKMMTQGINPTSVTLASVLPGFAKWRLLKKGKDIHGYAIRHGFKFETFLASALIEMYCQCGSLGKAEVLFKISSCNDMAIWNSMLAGYASEGDISSVFLLLHRVKMVQVKPNYITALILISLCARFTMLNQGKELHAYVIRHEVVFSISVSNSLINMYCKCGCLDTGVQVFEQMLCRDIVTYNTIIAAVGMHGHGDRAIFCFHQMKTESIKPDVVTFIALLSACSHAGLIQEGLLYYRSMEDDYGITPDMEHFSCVVDLYARSGFLDDAWEFIRKMPIEPDVDILGSLLGACRIYKRMDIAQLIGNWIIKKKPSNPGYYILLSNTYTVAGRWEDGVKVRKMMSDNGLVKIPGTSWIQ